MTSLLASGLPKRNFKAQCRLVLFAIQCVRVGLSNAVIGHKGDVYYHCKVLIMRLSDAKSAEVAVGS
jgi:hypothetical protein